MITHEQIRERLIESIRQSGMTQTEIAEKLNVGKIRADAGNMGSERLFHGWIRGFTKQPLD